MNLVELDQALRKLRLSGMADVLETHLQQAQVEQMAPIDLVAALVNDELPRRQVLCEHDVTGGDLEQPFRADGRKLTNERRYAPTSVHVRRIPPSRSPDLAFNFTGMRIRDADRALDGFDFAFNKKINRALVFELAAIQHGYRVIYREAHSFLEKLAEATLAETRKDYLAELTRVPLLIIDDLGMRKLPHTAAEDMLELIMRRYERASTMLTSNRPVEDWGKLLGDTAAVTALLDPPPPSLARAEVRAAELAHQGPDHLANRGCHEVKTNARLGRRKWPTWGDYYNSRF